MSRHDAKLGHWTPGDDACSVSGVLANSSHCLNDMSSEVTRTVGVFEETQRSRDAYEKWLSEMFRDTQEKIQKANTHAQQKCKHVLQSTDSFAARFDSELASMHEELQRELASRACKLEGLLDSLESRMEQLESGFAQQRQERIRQIEETLRPIREEVNRLTAALESERRLRRQEQNGREKWVADEKKSIYQLIDAEKFERESRFANVFQWAESEHQRLAKRQNQVDQDLNNVEREISIELQKEAQDRAAGQNEVIDGIVSFIQRYREQVTRDIEMQRPRTEALSKTINSVLLPVERFQASASTFQLSDKMTLPAEQIVKSPR